MLAAWADCEKSGLLDSELTKPYILYESLEMSRINHAIHIYIYA